MVTAGRSWARRRRSAYVSASTTSVPSLRSCASRKARTAKRVFSFHSPSSIPGEKPAASSSTCAWSTAAPRPPATGSAGRASSAARVKTGAGRVPDRGRSVSRRTLGLPRATDDPARSGTPAGRIAAGRVGGRVGVTAGAAAGRALSGRGATSTAGSCARAAGATSRTNANAGGARRRGIAGGIRSRESPGSFSSFAPGGNGQGRRDAAPFPHGSPATLVAAAHAACFNVALGLAPGQAGTPAERVGAWAAPWRA